MSPRTILSTLLNVLRYHRTITDIIPVDVITSLTYDVTRSSTFMATHGGVTCGVICVIPT